MKKNRSHSLRARRGFVLGCGCCSTRELAVPLLPSIFMWIESENGTLYNINWIQSIRLDPVADGGWVIKAQFALHNPPGNAGASRPHLVTTTLKKFALEHEAETAFETLKDRMGDIISFDR